MKRYKILIEATIEVDSNMTELLDRNGKLSSFRNSENRIITPTFAVESQSSDGCLHCSSTDWRMEVERVRLIESTRIIEKLSP